MINFILMHRLSDGVELLINLDHVRMFCRGDDCTLVNVGGHTCEFTEDFDTVVSTMNQGSQPSKPAPSEPNFRDRVIAECDELLVKIGKLETFVLGDVFDTLHGDERERLYRQLELMKHYSTVLRERIEAFPPNEDATA